VNSPLSRSAALPFLGRVRRDLLSNRHRCPACSRSVWPDDHQVHLRGDVYHAGCALYRRDRKVKA
jgi:hypothetical protein